MGIKDELDALFREGKSITDCIELDYKKSSVYKYNRIYKVELEKEQLKLLIDESERIKKVFNAFKNGQKLIDVVAEHGISPAQVRELHENYVELGEIEAGMGEKLDKINEILERKRVLQGENEGLEANLVKIKGTINKLYNSYRRLTLREYILARTEHLDAILFSGGLIMPKVDYSAEEQELALINDVRAILCSKGVQFPG